MPAGSSNALRDIVTYDDLLLLIRRFYDKLLVDDLISHYFVKLELDKHIPNVADFWAFILLDKMGYKNNMMNAHAHLHLKKEDYTRWLNLFHETIRENFSGEKATMAIERSELIALTMQYKLRD